MNESKISKTLKENTTRTPFKKHLSLFYIICYVFIAFSVSSLTGDSFTAKEFGTWGEWSTLVAAMIAYWGISYQLRFTHKLDIQQRAVTDLMKARADVLAEIRLQGYSPALDEKLSKVRSVLQTFSAQSPEYKEAFHELATFNASLQNKMEYLKMQAEALLVLSSRISGSLEDELSEYADFIGSKTNIMRGLNNIRQEERRLWASVLKELSHLLEE